MTRNTLARLRLPERPVPTFLGQWGPVLLALAFLVATTAQAAVPIPAPPAVNASGYVLVDFDSGHVIAEGNARERMEPASLTKLMTSYIVFTELATGNIALDELVPVSERAWRMPGSRSFIDVNSRVSVEDLLKGVIVQSGNDASVALAEHIAGSEDAFADLMNSYAASLDMLDTRFVNSTGLPHPEHYTTAHDLSLLMRALIRQYPEYYAWYGIREFTYNGITQPNRNRLLWRDDSVDGGKTGHTESAGYCLVASAHRDGMRLISVVLGTSSENARLQETQKLLNYGFRFFETHLVHAADTPVTQARVWQGDLEEVPLGIERDLYVTIPRNQGDKLATSLEIGPGILAPVRKGDRLGTLEVTLDGVPIANRPLVAARDVVEGSLARRLTDRVLMFFQ